MGLKLVTAVGALDKREVERIIVCDRTTRTFLILEISTIRQYIERFPWRNDPEAMKKIGEELLSGPFNYGVLFFVDE